ncbi:MAG: aspartate kinase [Sandaracinaceae bacterium]|nr:aspartate kinase [Sandaracinaceae bacterium]
MPIVVQKYGGSSVADVERLGRVADKVVATRRAGNDVVVVVSAMGKTTDELLALARQVDENPPRRELDMLLTTGERVSMALLSMAIQKRGEAAISFTGSQSGIITNDRHFDARIIEVRPHRIEDELARGRIVIIAGYQGMSYRREITTLGRGGSDTTAVAMAAALNATRAEIYSDVDGVYSADPRVVSDAHHLPTLSYDEMQEMAVAGAKVLNATAVEYAKRAKIIIHARSTFGGDRETVVFDVPSEKLSVTGQKRLARFTITGDDGCAQRALNAAEQASIEAQDFEALGSASSFLVATGLVPDWQKARQSIVEAARADVQVEEKLGAVSLIGSALSRSAGAMAQALVTIRDAGIMPLRTTSSPLRMSWLVRESDVDTAVQALHSALVR